MEKKKYTHENNQGSLFHETNCTVVRKGTIKIQGVDRYASILKYSAPDREDKFELSISVGLLNKVTDEQRSKSPKPENMPDIKGLINFNDTTYDFGGWRNVTSKGTEWTKIRLKETEIKSDETKTYKTEEKAPF
jgi:hypothetical protein|tara:strand:+ start:707 stop:1108 length:402 start_codon:yes stop_codon:yes gene_type:complete